MNLLLLHRFIRDAARLLDGATLGAPEWYRPVLTVPVTAGRRRRFLVAILERPGPMAFVADRHPLAGARGNAQLASAAGRVVEGVAQPGGDRVLELALAAPPDGAGDPIHLVLHLFGVRGRAFVVRDGRPVENVGAKIREDRPARPSRAGIVDATPERIAEALASSGDDTAPGAGIAGLDHTLARCAGGDADAIAAFRDTFVAGGTFDLAWEPGKAPGTAVPAPVGGSVGDEERIGPFENAVHAGTELGERALVEARSGILARLAQPVDRRIKAQRKLLRNLESDLDKAAGHEHVRREAEILATYRASIPVRSGGVDLPDPYADGETVRIELDPSLPLQTQIDKRFQKAGKLEKSEAHVTRRIRLVTREIEELRAARRLLDEPGDFATALRHLEAIRARFDIDPARSSPRAAKQRRGPGFRRFELGDGWFALVGRNNAENDELTFHHSSPADTWLHAQGIPGSHVILKSSGSPGNPPARVLQRAASIAAHFSKARHSGLVPVIYTQRKYVRKFRGARAGQVVCEREKSLMAEPWVPTDKD